MNQGICFNKRLNIYQIFLPHRHIHFILNKQNSNEYEHFSHPCINEDVVQNGKKHLIPTLCKHIFAICALKTNFWQNNWSTVNGIHGSL